MSGSDTPYNGTSRGLREVLRIALLILSSAYFALATLALVDYIVAPERYRFGTEVAGWRYYSEAHYLGSIAVGLVIAIVSIAGGFRARTRPGWLVMQASAAAGVVFLWLSDPK